MPRHAFLFVNGILTRPGNARGWTDRAVHWFNQREEGVACYPFEYYSPALLRFAFQRGHARDLAETIDEYAGHRIHLVGHSNGAELIERALAITPIRIDTIHLVAGAVERDFSKNELGRALNRGQVRRVFCLCSRGDAVLKYLARPSQVFQFLGLGYGDLGHRGPVLTALNDTQSVRTAWRDTLGHSEWFSAANFEATMETIRSQAFHP